MRLLSGFQLNAREKSDVNIPNESGLTWISKTRENCKQLVSDVGQGEPGDCGGISASELSSVWLFFC